MPVATCSIRFSRIDPSVGDSLSRVYHEQYYGYADYKPHVQLVFYFLAGAYKLNSRYADLSGCSWVEWCGVPSLTLYLSVSLHRMVNRHIL